MPKRLIFVFIIILCCCVFVAFGSEKTESVFETSQEFFCDVEICPPLASLGTLSAPQNLVFQSNGIATFDVVENADNYNVRLYDQTDAKIKDVATTSNSVDLSEYMIKSAGTYYFTVMAIDTDSDYENSPYSTASNTISTVDLTITYSRTVDSSYPTTAVGLIGKKYVDCLSGIDVSIDKYNYTWCFYDSENVGNEVGDEVGNAVVSNENRSLFVKYSGKPYTVKFVTNGGTSISNQQFNYDEERPVQLGNNGTEKPGFVFVGWCFNSNLADTPTNDIPAGTFGEITLYAKWRVQEFDIAVDILSGGVKEYDGFGASFRVTMTVDKSPYIDYKFNWYKGGFSSANLISSSAVSMTYTTGAGIDASGDYYVEVVAQNPLDVSDVFTKRVISPMTVSITKCTPFVTSFGTPVADGIYGNDLSSITLQGLTSNASGTVTFDYPDTALSVGKYLYAVTFVPDDTDNYNEVKGFVEINTIIPKDKRVLEIVFSVPENMIENGEEYTVMAVATNLEGDDDVKLLLSNNVQSRAGKYTAKIVGTEIVKAEFFDYQLPTDGLSCDFEILSAQIRTPDELSSDVEGTFVDDNGVPADAKVRITSSDFDSFGLNIEGNQIVIGKYIVEVVCGDESLERTGKVSIKINDENIDFERVELFVKTADGFEKIEFSIDNGRITFDAHTPARIVLVGEVEVSPSGGKSYVWIVVLLACIVLSMAFVIIFLALRVSKALREEGKKKRAENVENADVEIAGNAEEIQDENQTETSDETVIEITAENDENADGQITEIDENANDENADENALDESVSIDEFANENVGVADLAEGTTDVDENVADGASVDDGGIVETAIDVAVVTTAEDVENKKRKTFEDKLNEQDDEFIEYYNTLKDCIMQYEGVKSRASSGGETFRYKRAVAKLTIDGKTLRLHLALDPNDEKYNDGTCPHKDMSAYESYRDLPFMFKVKSGLALRRALKLIEDAMTVAGAKKPQ